VVPVLLAYAVILRRNLVAVDLEAVAVLLRGGIGHGDRGVHGGMGEPEQVRTAGAMRAIAQLISYELPLVFSSLGS